MKKYYYIPVNSLNFNNILSSESISPMSFYEKRGFGFRRFERINANPLLNSILAYDKIPRLPDTRSDREEYPIFLAVPENYFNNSFSRKKENDVELIQMDGSIYLNWMECFFFSRTEEEKKKLIASTRRSIEVKHVDHYISNIFVLDDYNIDMFDWNESVIENISDSKNSNQDQILRDQKINKIKGFIYAYTSGKLKEQPSEMAEGNRYFKDFVNSYSALMNDLSVLSRENKRKGSRFDYNSVKKEIKHLEDIKGRIDILFTTFEQSEIDDLLKKSFAIDDAQIELFKNLNYEKTRVTIYSLISDFNKDKDQSLYTIGELLNILIKNVNTFLKNSSASSYKNLENDFNSLRIVINNKINDFRKETITENSFENIPFEFNTGFSELRTNLEEISPKENESYSLIINEFLSRIELSTSDEIAQQRLDILQNVAELIKKSDENDTTNVDYLRKLYKSLKTVGVGYKIDESDDNALRSFACFLSRYSEMEKLQDFMDKNKFYHYGLSFGIWGAAYGYANISKLLIEPLNSNNDTLSFITKYINEITLKEEIDEGRIERFINSLSKKEVKSNVKNWKVQADKLNAPNTEDNYEIKESSIGQTKTIEEPKEYEFDKNIDNKIKEPFIDADKNTEETELDETPKIVELKVNDDVNEPETSFQNEDDKNRNSFMELIKGNKLLGSNNDWVSLIEHCYKNVDKQLDLLPEMGLGTKKHEFEKLLKEEKENRKIKGFGDQKMKEAINIFTKHIQSNE